MSVSVFGSQDATESFLYACAVGDIPTVSDSIRCGIFIDVEDSIGNTGLQIASAAGHLGAIEILLSSGASVDKSNCYGWTALHQAACAGHVKVVHALIQQGSAPSKKTKYGQSVLALATFGGHVKIVHYLLSLNVNWNEIESNCPTGYCTLSALLIAAAHGKLDVLTSLVNSEAIDQKSSLTSTTALMLAAVGGHVDCYRFLSENGANVALTDCAGRNAIAYGAMLGHRFTVAGAEASDPDPNEYYYYEEANFGSTDIFEALRGDDLDLLNRLLIQFPNLKSKETIDGNRTVIIEAINSKNVKAVKILLAAGCSVNAVASKSGKTALAHAVEDCFEDGILMLLDAGADPTIKDCDGKSALDAMAHRLCQLSQHVIRKMCQAGLTQMAPNMLNSIDESLFSSAALKVSPSTDDLKSNKTLFGKLKAKFTSGSKSKLKHESVACLPADMFLFPCAGPLSFSGNNTAGAHLELDPVRVDPLTPPFDRRKLIWTDGAPDDSTTSGPPMSSSLKGVDTVPPGTLLLTQRPKPSRKTSSSKTPSTMINASATGYVASGDESTGDESELKGYLRKNKLDHYGPLLKNNEINDLTTFKLLTERDLQDLKVGTMDRHSLIRAISKARNLPKL